MNKHLLILGANSDIGKDCAIFFHGKGFSLTLASRSTQELRSFCKKNNIVADIIAFDALNTASHKEFYLNLPHKPSVVICAFGYLVKNTVSYTNFQEAEKIINTNFTGAVSILNIISQDMKEQQQGCIIGISSVAADRGRASNLIYGAAKAGFDAYLSGLRNMMDPHNVNVITVRPGFVKTKMIAQHPTPSFLTSSAETIAKKIYNAYRNKRNIVYSDLKWRTIMLIIQSIPERIFKKLNL